MPLIKNWGFMWQRKYLFRGTGGAGNRGHLKGHARGQPKADFEGQIGVYMLHDSNQRLVYVGQAGNGNATLFNRLKQHMDGRLAGRWDYFTWFGFLSVNTNGSLSAVARVNSRVSGYTYSQALDELEGVLIEVIEPPLNKQGGKLKDAVEYTQDIDERVDDILNTDLLRHLEKISDKLDKLEDKSV